MMYILFTPKKVNRFRLIIFGVSLGEIYEVSYIETLVYKFNGQWQAEEGER